MVTIRPMQLNAQRPRLICRSLTGVAIAVSAWAAFYPRPYRLAIALLLVMPWLAVYVASRYEGLVVINEKRRDPHPSVAVPFLIPGLVLALRAIRDMNPLGWERPLLLAIVVSAILIFAACLADQALRKQRFAVGLIFLLSLGYGYGAAMETNAAFDRSASTVCASKVRRKYVNSGRSTSYHLVLAPWGPKETEDNVMVSRAFYDTQQVGDPVCISLRKGALGIAWYAVGYCQ